MENRIVHKLFVAVLVSFAFLAGVARADTFHLTDGSTLSGDIVSLDDKGVVLKQADGTYAERLPWGKLSQADLKDLDQNNPKAAPFVEPFIEDSPDAHSPRPVIDVKAVPHFARPVGHSLLGALFTSSTGFFTLLMLYAANLYAGYEISIFRAQPVGLVCGVSAVVPVIGPIVFLAMPSKIKTRAVDWNVPPEQQIEPAIAAAIAAEQEVPVEHHAEIPIEGTTVVTASAPPPSAAAVAAAAAAQHPKKVFLRGQTTFNRRFFETQLAGFLAMSRPEADQDKVLIIRANRGTYNAQRISRLAANELQLHVQKGPAFEDITVPFVEIQEVQVKHKDA
jgi:hypothetical protein